MKIDTLILSSGGSNCYTFLGALKYLIHAGMLHPKLEGIKHILGVSGGSLFITPLLLGYSIDVSIQLFLSFNISKVTDIHDFSLTQLLCDYGFFSNDYLEKIIHCLLKQKGYGKDITLKQLYDINKINFVSKVVNISKHTMEFINYQSYPDIPLFKVLQMTTCVPIIFRPIKYNDEYYIDGAVMEGGFPIEHSPSTHFLGIQVKVENDTEDIKDITDYISQLFQALTPEKKKYKHTNRIINISCIGHGCKFKENIEHKKKLVQTGYLTTKKHFETMNVQKHTD